ncbi:hypothetical protein M0638_27490 [Roseomonas sp. NAR14]|uniref:FG-GAP repeat protein n=1 Tax=Roseomonas acroporae TaxID=2937791 RepID=A0A9X1YDE6_9PROT|nr:hypothetical protein [Roseomonas acroporae]MCK8788103.1 hypothetical protein [Roseomonas acroporae]
MKGTHVSGGGYTAFIYPGWAVEGIGDYNGDGDDDVLWQHDNGGIVVWDMTAAPSQTVNTVCTVVVAALDANWDLL